jgi:hypothetical protein
MPVLRQPVEPAGDKPGFFVALTQAGKREHDACSGFLALIGQLQRQYFWSCNNNCARTEPSQGWGPGTMNAITLREAMAGFLVGQPDTGDGTRQRLATGHRPCDPMSSCDELPRCVSRCGLGAEHLACYRSFVRLRLQRIRLGTDHNEMSKLRAREHC